MIKSACRERHEAAKVYGFGKLFTTSAASPRQPLKGLPRDIGRNRVLTIEFAEVDGETRAAKIASDLPAGAIDRQDWILRAVREKEARLSDARQRDQKAGGEGENVREEIAVRDAERNCKGSAVREARDREMR